LGSDRRVRPFPVPLAEPMLAGLRASPLMGQALRRVSCMQATLRRASWRRPTMRLIAVRHDASWYDASVEGWQERIARELEEAASEDTVAATTVSWWCTGGTLRTVPTRYRRIQVTEDPELAGALRAAAPHLPAGLSRARQVRELALVGARQIVEAPFSEQDRRALLERLAARFEEPTTAGIDWDALREGKRRAWPTE
jgi:hypothetical protein